MVKCIIYSKIGNGFNGCTVKNKDEIKQYITSDQHRYYILNEDDKFEDFYMEDGMLKKKDEEYHFNLKCKNFYNKLVFNRSMKDEEVDSIILNYFDNKVNVNNWKKENYSYIRGFFYPPESELYDGMTKVNSDDPTIKQEGEKQMQSYFAECLAVKKRFPKP